MRGDGDKVATPETDIVPQLDRVRTISGAVLEQAKVRALPLVNRTADLVPAAQACCGICRTCTTTNLLTVAGAVAAGAAAYAARVARRLTAVPRPSA
ncbi:MAG TPA: hypothetical protein VFA66_15705 [Gaiellaceae bacterium]|nr:hypothetical protein [Gaiellaceae bacterium]